MAMSHDGFLELLDATDQKHAEAHKRLRLDFRELELRMDESLKVLGDRLVANQVRLNDVATLASTPVDVTKLVLTPKIVATIVTVILTVFGGMWATTTGLRSDLRDILTRMASEQRVSDANAKLIELNNATINRALESNARELKDSIASVNKRQELLSLQYAELKDSITRLTAQRR